MVLIFTQYNKYSWRFRVIIEANKIAYFLYIYILWVSIIKYALKSSTCIKVVFLDWCHQAFFQMKFADLKAFVFRQC